MSRKPGRLAKVLWALGVVAVLLILSGYVFRLRGKSELTEYRAQLTAAGEVWSLDILAPAPLPPEQNSQALFRQATDLMDSYPENVLDTNAPPTMRMVAPGKAMTGWRQPDVRYSETTNTWEAVHQALSDRAGALDLLHEMIDQPLLAFDLDYRQGVNLLLPHLMSVKRSAQLLSAATVGELQRNSSEAAVTNTRALFAIVNAWTNEPLVISLLVRIAATQIGINATWEILQSPSVTESHLTALQGDCERLSFVNEAEHSLVAERAFISMNVAHLRGSNSPFSTMTGYGLFGGSAPSASGGWTDAIETAWRGAKLKTKETLWKAALSYPDELRAMRACEVLIDAAREVQTNGFFHDALARQKRELQALGLDRGSPDFMDLIGEDPADIDPRWVVSKSVSSLDRVLNRVMTAQAGRNLALTAIALKRFHLRHGHYPPELPALVPEYLNSIPLDPVDGKPLRYRVETGDTFVLYSVGEDAKDDGGDPAPEPPSKSSSWQRGRDWLWPQPATDAEIEVYQANSD